jgi:phage-related protein (TIGR01555 family)
MTMFEQLTAAAVRIDSWFNALTKVGLDYNKTAFQFARAGRIDDATLEGLYNEDPFAARICDAFPEEATRQGFTLKLGCAEHETALMARLDALGAVEKLKEAWTWARVFGGAVVFVGADDGLDARLPLDESRIRSIRFLTVLDRRDLQPQTWYLDPLNPRFGSPETYTFTVSGGGGGTDSRTVHQSRLIRFDGALVTRRERIRNNWWGGSELNRVFIALQQFNGAFASSATLLQEASQGVLSIKNLYRLLVQDKDDTLKKRFEAMDMARSIGRSVLIDADGEKYERIESSAFSGLPDTVDRFMFMLAGASRIPVTILMGQAPAGLNATGDSDIRTFYDRVRTAQTTTLKPRLLRLVRLFLLAQDGPTQGQLPATTDVEFNPLYQMTPKEQAELRKLVADTDGVNIDKGIVTAEEVAINRFRPGGWSMETVIDLDARRAVQEADASSAAESDGAHEDIAAVIAKVAARELPRASGVALLVSSLGLSPEEAEAVMGETGRSFFTAPEPGHAAEMEALRAENKALKASNEGHKAYTARVIQRAKEGGLELGAFTSQKPTETEEGDVLEEGDVVAVPNDQGAQKDGA